MVRSPVVLGVAMLVIAAAGAGCSSDDFEPESDAPALPEVPVDGVLPEMVDDSPFCRAMLAVGTVDGDGLARDTPGDGPGDSPASDASLDDLVALFVDVADEAPAEIRPDFDVVLERLVTVAAGGEVTDPDRADESANELATFIELHCRGTAMNPLPPPTSPGAPVDDS